MILKGQRRIREKFLFLPRCSVSNIKIWFTFAYVVEEYGGKYGEFEYTWNEVAVYEISGKSSQVGKIANTWMTRLDDPEDWCDIQYNEPIT